MKIPVPGGIPVPGRKSRLQRAVDDIVGSLDVTSGLKSDNARKAGLIAGAVAGITAGSAGISSLRRRNEGARGDS